MNEKLQEFTSVMKSFTKDWTDAYLRVDRIIRDKPNSIEFSFGAMYERPQMNLGSMVKLIDIFGTSNIDLDDYAHCGCETCDYGSDYGHTIQVYGMTYEMYDLVLQYLGNDLFDIQD